MQSTKRHLFGLYKNSSGFSFLESNLAISLLCYFAANHLPSAISLAVLGVVPAGILILYPPSCSGKTRRDLGTGTSSLFEVAVVIGAATLRRGAVLALVVELGSSLEINLLVTLMDLSLDLFICNFFRLCVLPENTKL